MAVKKKVLAISGSTRQHSANFQILKAIADMAVDIFDVEIYNEIGTLPHFNPDMDVEQVPVPAAVADLRKKISEADGVVICTPEYVFSLPGALKNAIEWTVSTTLFSEKPVALITASALGQKAHEALQLIMKTIYARFDEQTQLLISGVRAKVKDTGIVDEDTLQQVRSLVSHFAERINRIPS